MFFILEKDLQTAIPCTSSSVGTSKMFLDEPSTLIEPSPSSLVALPKSDEFPITETGTNLIVLMLRVVLRANCHCHVDLQKFYFIYTIATCNSDLSSAAANTEPASEDVASSNTENVASNTEDRFDSEDCEINFFTKPSKRDLARFLNYHPQQPSERYCKITNKVDKLPFNAENIFFRIESGQRVRRNWLSFYSETNSLFCYVCLAFSKNNYKSPFTDIPGFNKWSHVRDRISEHEKSKSHIEGVKTLLREVKGHTIKNILMTGEQLGLRKTQVMNRRIVVIRIIQAIKYLGKQGLAFRGHRHEGAHELFDLELKRGNFLEAILLLAKADPILKEHVLKVAEMSLKTRKKRAEGTSKVIGRGKFVTFLSKNTLSKIISTITSLMLQNITCSIKSAEIYSIMMDSTTDVSAWDQCAFVIRFVEHTGKVAERLLVIKRVMSSTGEDLHKLLEKTLAGLGIDAKNCVADSFDGASNMSGQYKSVSARLIEKNKNHIHTWCLSHVMNLFITEVTECTVPAISLFGLLQELSSFFKDSYKRMIEYEKTNPRLKLRAIGKTRWTSKNEALTKLFGSFDHWKTAVTTNLTAIDEIRTKAVFLSVVSAFKFISEDKSFAAKVRHEAVSLKDKLLKYETILTAITFSAIFEASTPVTKYLQTINLDYVTSWRQVDGMIKKVEKLRNDFPKIVQITDKFISVMNKELSANGLEIETQLPSRRSTRTISESSIRDYEIQVYNVMLDTAIVEVKSRFENHRELYGDLECFDARKFKEITENGLPTGALTRVCQLTEVDEEKLQSELLSFAFFFPTLQLETWENIYSNPGEPVTSIDSSETESEDSEGENAENEDERGDQKCEDQKRCSYCLSCILQKLIDLRLYVTGYENLFCVYKYLLTLPMTQVM